MNIVDFLPLSVYEFTCDDALVERIASIVADLPTKQNTHNARSETDLFYDAELYEWFNKCIGEAKTKLHIPNDINLEITGCWSNTTKKLQMHHQHSHANSFMSGILYLSGPHSGGKTEFTTDNVWWRKFDWIRFKDGDIPRTISQQYIPQKGKLLLFPSSLMHKVTALTDSSTRYSMAFNTFFSGPIGGNTGLTRLELKSKSVADHNET